MNSYILKFLFLFLFFSSSVSAQLSDLARLDYTVLPKGNSDVKYSRFRALFNYPVKLKKEGTYLLLGLDYSHIDLYMEDNPSFDKSEVEGFQNLNLNIGYTASLRNDWRIGIRLTPGFSSNLKANDLNFEDIVFSSDLVFIKDKKKDPEVDKPWRLIIGISYSGHRGIPFPLPFISYYKKFKPKWSYNVGIPKSNLQLHLSEMHRFKLYAELDGFTSNLQRGLIIDDTKVAESIIMSIIAGGIQYEYHISDHIEFFARSSYILSNTVKFRDDKKDKIKGLDNSNLLYLRTGIRLKM
jgi:hypothetical protein